MSSAISHAHIDLDVVDEDVAEKSGTSNSKESNTETPEV